MSLIHGKSSCSLSGTDFSLRGPWWKAHTHLLAPLAWKLHTLFTVENNHLVPARYHGAWERSPLGSHFPVKTLHSGIGSQTMVNSSLRSHLRCLLQSKNGWVMHLTVCHVSGALDSVRSYLLPCWFPGSTTLNIFLLGPTHTSCFPISVSLFTSSPLGTKP